MYTKDGIYRSSSHHSTYQAYGVDIYKYRYNRDSFKQIVADHNYKLHQLVMMWIQNTIF